MKDAKKNNGIHKKTSRNIFNPQKTNSHDENRKMFRKTEK